MTPSTTHSCWRWTRLRRNRQRCIVAQRVQLHGEGQRRSPTERATPFPPSRASELKPCDILARHFRLSARGVMSHKRSVMLLVVSLKLFNFQLSSFNFQLSTSNCQLSTSNFQLPTSYIEYIEIELPTSNFQEVGSWKLANGKSPSRTMLSYKMTIRYLHD